MKTTFSFTVEIGFPDDVEEEYGARYLEGLNSSVDEFGAALKAFLDSQPLVICSKMEKKE